MRRSLTVATMASAMLLAACSSINPEIRAAEPLRCPEGSACFDEAIPVGPGGMVELLSGDLWFETLAGVRTTATEIITLQPVNEGPVSVTLQNVGAADHNFRIDAAAGDAKKVDAAGGETVEGILQLYSGEYTFYCDIPGHRAAGMVGQITVLPAGEIPGDGTDGEALSQEAPADETPEPDNSPTPELDQTEAPAEPTEEPVAIGADATEADLESFDDSDRIAEALDSGSRRAKLAKLTFESGSAEISAEGRTVIADLAAYLDANPEVNILIEGNSDSVGSDASNQELSETRASAVRTALIDAGIDGDRLQDQGNGETDPVVEDDTSNAVARRINRRVEVSVTN